MKRDRPMLAMGVYQHALALLPILLMLPLRVQAQFALGPQFSGGGGGFVVGPDVRLLSTIGQPAAGAAANDLFRQNAGFVEVAVAGTSANEPPVVTGITAPLDPVPVNTEIVASGEFTDPDASDTHTADWDWGDGTTSAGVVTEAGGAGMATGTHTYAAAGVYTLTLTVTDDSGNIGTAIFQYVVVYDPDGGFVTGGGWIHSPPGAYVSDPSLEGKANFGFVSKYKKGAMVPTGATQFQFKTGNLDFYSTSYEWLVVAGAKAKYKGEGTVNGDGRYGFILSAIDEKLTSSTDVDKFRIKIWDKEADDALVYDNQLACPGQPTDDADPCTSIGGGSIVIHKSGAPGKAGDEADLAVLDQEVPAQYALLPNYPNPFNPSTTIRFELPEDVDVRLKVYDTLGREVAKLAGGTLEAGVYEKVWDGRDASGTSVASGVYLVQIEAGIFRQTRLMTLLK